MDNHTTRLYDVLDATFLGGSEDGFCGLDTGFCPADDGQMENIIAALHRPFHRRLIEDVGLDELDIKTADISSLAPVMDKGAHMGAFMED